MLIGKIAKECIIDRPLLSEAINADMQKLNSQLYEEELSERQKDIAYWAPLRRELEILRHNDRGRNAFPNPQN